MKKRFLVGVLATAMCLSMVACGSKDKEDDKTTTTTEATTEKDNTTENDASDDNATVDDNNTTDNNTTEEETSTSADATIGQGLVEKFNEADASKSALDIATILAGVYPDYNCVSMEVEPGLLVGFDNYEVKGFTEGATFAPMIGTIPFVGYVFTLEDGADTEAFVNDLTSNCNPAWNICTQADETVTAVNGNKVLFVMCPKHMAN